MPESSLLRSLYFMTVRYQLEFVSEDQVCF